MKKYTLIKLAVVVAMITMVGTAFAWDGYGMSNKGISGGYYRQCTQDGNSKDHGSNDDLKGR